MHIKKLLCIIVVCNRINITLMYKIYINYNKLYQKGECVRMLKISVLEFFFRTVPESFIIIFTSLLFTKKVLIKKHILYQV